MSMNVKRIAIAGGCLGAAVLFFLFDLERFLTLEALQVNRQALVEYCASHRIAVVLEFLAVYIAQTALSLPGASVLSLAAGAIFGTTMGTVYAIGAATVGATLAFLVSRYLFRDAVAKRFEAPLDRLDNELKTHGLTYLLFLRLTPLFPFFLVNLASGVTRIPLRTYVVGTMIGIIPRIFVYVNAGASLATVDSLSGILSPRVLGAWALLGLFALIPAFSAKMKPKR
jgi:uncharacterized membrane protein YdjX (TVP38/TMEM64 family)